METLWLWEHEQRNISLQLATAQRKHHRFQVGFVEGGHSHGLNVGSGVGGEGERFGERMIGLSGAPQALGTGKRVECVKVEDVLKASSNGLCQLVGRILEA